MPINFLPVGEGIDVVGIFDVVLDLCHSEKVCFINDVTATFIDIDPYWDKHKYDWIKQYHKIVGKKFTVWVYSNGSHEEDMRALDVYFNKKDLVKIYQLN